MSPEDVKLRKCLENLRYRACSPDDIELLETRIAGRGPSRPKLNQPRFRNVSIITRLGLKWATAGMLRLMRISVNCFTMWILKMWYEWVPDNLYKHTSITIG